MILIPHKLDFLTNPTNVSFAPCENKLIANTKRQRGKKKEEQDAIS